MGLILIPSEIMEEAELLRSCITDTVEKHRGALRAIQDFVNAEELETKTWQTLKEKVFEYHEAIGQGVILAEDSILTDLAVVEQSVGAEELYEDMLVESIKKLEAEKQERQAEIGRLQTLRSNFIVRLSGSLGSYIDYYIKILEDELAKIEQVLAFLNEKLQFLYDAETSTQGLFDSALQLLKSTGAAINDAGVEITGEGAKSEIAWRIVISNAAQEMDEKIEKFIEETLQSELNIDVDELREIYGDDVINLFKESMERDGISRLAEGSEEKFIKAMLTDVTDFDVVKTNGRYEYIDKKGNQNPLTREVIYKKIEVAVYMKSSKEIAEWYVANVPTYCHMTASEIIAAGGPSTALGRKYYQCDLSGELSGLNVGDDCSSYLWATLVQAGYFSADTEISKAAKYLPNDKAGLKMAEAGFTWHPMSELDWNDLQAGDILVKNGHVEIFCGYDGKRELALTWGKVYKKVPMHKDTYTYNIESEYKGIWRLEP